MLHVAATPGWPAWRYRPCWMLHSTSNAVVAQWEMCRRRAGDKQEWRQTQTRSPLSHHCILILNWGGEWWVTYWPQRNHTTIILEYTVFFKHALFCRCDKGSKFSLSNLSHREIIFLCLWDKRSKKSLSISFFGHYDKKTAWILCPLKIDFFLNLQVFIFTREVSGVSLWSLL